MSYCGSLCRNKYSLFEWGKKKKCKEECAANLELANAPQEDPKASEDTEQMYDMMKIGLIALSVISFLVFAWLFYRKFRKRR